jgi:hypothetical protein
MPCIRCGELVIENWWDCVEDVSQKKLQGTRCVNCGAIDDPLIVANRLRPHPARLIVPRGIAAGMGHVPVSLVLTEPNAIRPPRAQSFRIRMSSCEERVKGSPKAASEGGSGGMRKQAFL